MFYFYIYACLLVLIPHIWSLIFFHILQYLFYFISSERTSGKHFRKWLFHILSSTFWRILLKTFQRPISSQGIQHSTNSNMCKDLTDKLKSQCKHHQSIEFLSKINTYILCVIVFSNLTVAETLHKLIRRSFASLFWMSSFIVFWRIATTSPPVRYSNCWKNTNKIGWPV
jgi:hypothetical protein